jgi:hypothetical protein
MFSSSTLVIFLAAAVSALPTEFGVKFDKRDLPTLTLPYGTWQANSYDLLNDM